jgi:hypothetical protein
MDDVTRNAVFDDLKQNKWFGTAIEEYSHNELVAAGLQPPLTGIVRASRDDPVEFYGDHDHPYVRFGASTRFDWIRATAAEGAAVVLIAMGSYAPMHQGHIAMMEAADRAVRAEGDTPIGAVFSLHGARHVQAKILPTRPDAPIATDTRYAQACEVCPETLSSGTPTFIDKWDAMMPGGPRCFTDIMTRTSNILVAAGLRGVTPVAVFGSDNGVSMRAFAQYGQAVCVIRPNHEDEADRYIAEPQMKVALRQRRVLIAQREDKTVISSSDIRARKGGHL